MEAELVDGFTRAAPFTPQNLRYYCLIENLQGGVWEFVGNTSITNMGCYHESAFTSHLPPQIKPERQNCDLGQLVVFFEKVFAETP